MLLQLDKVITNSFLEEDFISIVFALPPHYFYKVDFNKSDEKRKKLKARRIKNVKCIF